MLIGIDLLWVRPGRCGGTESYIRNLLSGFNRYDDQNEYMLFVTKDNAESFKAYTQASRMKLKICPISCEVQAKRILWENLNLDKYARQAKVDIMFIPVYSKPHSRQYNKKNGIPYISVIHDLQALHYPQYFSKARNLFLRHAWKQTCKTSAQVITDSNYCKTDILKHYQIQESYISTIYIPICQTIYDSVSGERFEDSEVDDVLKKYGLCRGAYDYCVSSLLPHKNLDTVLQVMSELKHRGTPKQLVLSGVGGNVESFKGRLQELDIEECIIQTGFVSDQDRDCLYKGCRLFLFPSVFEGFGMPPIEAMRMGKRVVMTKESCLFEVTNGKAVYVDDPYSVEKWIERMEFADKLPERTELFPQYNLETITKQYLQQFQKAILERKKKANGK